MLPFTVKFEKRLDPSRKAAILVPFLSLSLRFAMLALMAMSFLISSINSSWARVSCAEEGES